MSFALVSHEIFRDGAHADNVAAIKAEAARLSKNFW